MKKVPSACGPATRPPPLTVRPQSRRDLFQSLCDELCKSFTTVTDLQNSRRNPLTGVVADTFKAKSVLFAMEKPSVFRAFPPLRGVLQVARDGNSITDRKNYARHFNYRNREWSLLQ